MILYFFYIIDQNFRINAIINARCQLVEQYKESLAVII